MKPTDWDVAKLTRDLLEASWPSTDDARVELVTEDDSGNPRKRIDTNRYDYVLIRETSTRTANYSTPQMSAEDHSASAFLSIQTSGGRARREALIKNVRDILRAHKTDLDGLPGHWDKVFVANITSLDADFGSWDAEMVITYERDSVVF